MKLIDHAKALNHVFDEHFTVEELLEAMNKYETLEIEQTLIQEEILKEAYNHMDDEDKKRYVSTCEHAWEDFYDLCDEVEEECNIDLRRFYGLEM